MVLSEYTLFSSYDGKSDRSSLPKLNTDNTRPTIQLNSAGSSLFPETSPSQFNPKSEDFVPLTPRISPVAFKRDW